MWHAIQHILGVDDPSGAWYLWWSGFFADILIFGVPIVWWRHHNCHEKRCWRLGHPVNGRVHCKRHWS